MWAVRARTQPALAENIGIAAVLVQAKDAAAKAWYVGQAEWLEVTAGGRTLWLPVGVVGDALDHAPYHALGDYVLKARGWAWSLGDR